MLGWLTGTPSKGASTPSYHDTADAPDTSLADAPQTPGPIFAIRAFKTALFGTPQLTDHADRYTKPVSSAANVAGQTGGDGKQATQPTQPRRASTLNEASITTRPNGILLTPGTGGGRRKTVSFGEGIADKENRQIGRSGLPENCPGKFPSPWSVRSTAGSTLPARPTPLTQSLLDARSSVRSEDTNIRKETTDQRSRSMSRSNPPDLRPTQPSIAVDEPTIDEADTTIDLEQPRSTSGRYWKSELETYHSQTDREMKKLIKYKEMAKSYAKKKDREATSLSQKLREERARVARMEQEVSSLAGDLSTRRSRGLSHGPEHDDMIAQLARQTALVVEWKEKAARTQSELDRQQQHVATSQELAETQQQLKEFKHMRAQLDELRDGVKRAEKKNAQAEDENLRLQQENGHLKEELRRRTKEVESTRRAADYINDASQTGIDRSHQDALDRLAAQHHQKMLQTLRELGQAKEESSDLRMELMTLRRELRETKAENRRSKRHPTHGPSIFEDPPSAVAEPTPPPPQMRFPSLPSASRGTSRGKPSLSTAAQISSALGTSAADRALLDLSVNVTSFDTLGAAARDHVEETLQFTGPIDFESTLPGLQSYMEGTYELPSLPRGLEAVRGCEVERNTTELTPERMSAAKKRLARKYLETGRGRGVRGSR